MEDTSSTSTCIPRPSFLRRTIEQLSTIKTLKLRVEEEDAANVAVLALQRYFSDQNGRQPCESYSYDVTVTDGVCRAKCCLHPSLNHLIHTNTLRTGSDIIITQCSFVYNERVLGHRYIGIEKLRCVSGKSALLSQLRDVSTLPVLVKSGMERNTLLPSNVPLQLGCKHYLSLWDNEQPEGDMWISVPTSHAPVLDVKRITLIDNLESVFNSTRQPPPLLVKIIQKSRLRYYGKPGCKIDFPYQAYFEVADQSGITSLVLWNELCPQFYNSFNVGTVLYIQNYTLKESYSNRSRPQMDHYGIKIFTSIEICLNAHTPTSIITVVPPKNVRPQWSLPDVSYRFATRAEVETFAKDSVCDVIGLVTFVGRVERVKRKGNTGPEKYWSFRWVHAMDRTTEHPFVLQLFNSSQPEIFDSIWPMAYLVCTQMRVCHVEGCLPYLTSSCETEMFITGYHKGQPYKNNPIVQSLMQRNKTLKDNEVLPKTAVGGHYCYPHAPPTFTQPTAATSEQVPLVAASDLKKELETLQYREHKKLAIQGQIVAVRYVEKSNMTETQGLGAKGQVPSVSTGDRAMSDVSNVTGSDASASPKQTSVKRKRMINTRDTEHSSVSSVPAKRGARNPEVEREQPEDEGDSESRERSLQPQNEGRNLLSWESSGWSRQRQDVTVHLCHATLHQDSISRRFTLDDKNALLRWSNLHPMRWTPEQSADTLASPVFPGYYQVTILGINKQIAVDATFLPIVSSREQRAVGLPLGRHDNTMLACLSSGFLCPLEGSGHSWTSRHIPENIMATAGELEDTNLVCVLDICHLGGEEVEVVISKVYKVTEVSVA
ncbi:RPA-related protein RADX isoform X1 [Syngnathus acus]|uniref:RPA-related protein RADX isoform X1 n=1 Tax=Syngnathus acus TaxID=161584 RepID=UPI001885C471|nr:RPA-related protein RADX isoform X1 [Syngnathus acus]